MITLTEQSVREAAERYRDSTQLNPYDEVADKCRNLMDGQHCLAAQILFDHGVTDEQLAQLSDQGILSQDCLTFEDRDDLIELLDNGIVSVGDGVRDILSALQKAADVGGNQLSRLPWGEAVERVLG